MKLILVDPNPTLCWEWERAFLYGDWSKLPEVRVHNGVFQDVHDATALVTAGNSFGLMDGGVDLAVARAFPGIEGHVQSQIRYQYAGELLVGNALDIEFEDCRNPTVRSTTYKALVYAPTMRVPMSIVGTDAVYRAMWAALLAASHLDVWGDTLVVPGLGTGAGRMSEFEAARQMALAWRNFTHPPAPERMDWPTATGRHHEIAGESCCRPVR